MDSSYIIIAVRVDEDVETAMDTAGGVADLLRNNGYEDVAVINTIPASPSLAKQENQDMGSYLEREIKYRLAHGQDHQTIARVCGVAVTFVERLAVEA